MDTKTLEFVTYCISKLAQVLKMSQREVYRRLKNSGILYDTQKKAKNTSIIPTFDLPSSTQKDSYKTIFKKTQKNHPKIKCINYFIYGKWKESHFKKIVYY